MENSNKIRIYWEDHWTEHSIYSIDSRMIVDLQYFIIMELDELYMVNFIDNSWLYGLSKIVHSVEVWISVAHGYYPYIYIYICISPTISIIHWSLARMITRSSRVGLSGAWAKGSGCLSQGIAGPCDSVEKCGLIIYLIVYIYIYIYVYVYVCVCVCVCVCVYIYIRICL